MRLNTMLTWPDFPEMFGENYHHTSIETIKDNPKKWLASLPMFEYAYMVLMSGIQSFGDRVKDNTQVIFDEHLLPILNEYHKALMHYRVYRMIALRGYDSDRQKLEEAKTDLRTEFTALMKLTKETRYKLREAVVAYVHSLETDDKSI